MAEANTQIDFTNSDAAAHGATSDLASLQQHIPADVPLALAMIGLGLVILAMPSVPGLILTSGAMPNL